MLDESFSILVATVLRGVTTHYCIGLGVHLRRLDDEIAVYLARCFETHLVDDVGGQILEAVQQMQSAAQPCSVQALYAWMSDNSDLEAATQSEFDAEAALMPLLSELVRISVLKTQVC